MLKSDTKVTQIFKNPCIIGTFGALITGSTPTTGTKQENPCIARVFPFSPYFIGVLSAYNTFKMKVKFSKKL